MGCELELSHVFAGEHPKLHQALQVYLAERETGATQSPRTAVPGKCECTGSRSGVRTSLSVALLWRTG